MHSKTIRFDNIVVAITNGGSQVGKQLALDLASRGASVVVQDDKKHTADAIVDEIRRGSGSATACLSPARDGHKVVEEAIRAFGAIHVLINNMSIDPCASKKFGEISDKEWDIFTEEHIYGTYKSSRAAWPYFKKQKLGRIIHLVPTTALSGHPTHAVSPVVEFGMIGFTETLAKEGLKNNILCNLIMAPSTFAPEVLMGTVALAGLLSHPSSRTSNALFEADRNSISRLSWERSKPHGLKTDSNLSVSAVLQTWPNVGDFANSDTHPDGPWDAMELLEKSKHLPANSPGENMDFKAKVAVVTGAGNGLGQQYALLLARMGAKVVVNDLADPQKTVDMIKAAGGQAIADRHSVEEGDKIIQTALDAYGGIHILINNAGILRDKSFQAMTDDMWRIIQAVHLRGTYKTARAAWPHFVRQKYGRIVNTTSVSGIYGNFGQSNYATAKCGTIGLSCVLAREGLEHNIRVNTIGPSAGTQLTRTVMPEEMVQALKPDYVAPFTLALLSDRLPGSSTNGLYEIGSGFIAVDRLRRAALETIPSRQAISAESLKASAQWSRLNSADITASQTSSNGALLPAPLSARKDETIKYQYSTKDVILYNLGIGAQATDGQWVFEGSRSFEALPTFGVIPYYDPSVATMMADMLPNFSMKRVLHGEQYLEIRKFPIPVSGNLITYPAVSEIVDKGKAAVVVTTFRTVDSSTQEDVFYNEQTIFVNGSGGFGGSRTSRDRGPATAPNKVPSRAPDAVKTEKVSERAAALYRLSGDLNPLHIDPDTAKGGGFDKPILHGLCSFGISAKHIYTTYGPFRNIKARFSSVTLPGQTLKTSMWKEGRTVIFTTSIVETGQVVLSAAAVELLGGTARM
ncbi:hypothetical protein Z517_05327 [Fonsecaea pedrosoi CBS 271.37]|uniref:Ketoreductase domain-containing protein n=1 Tax=Fonsecaea pedrosoi CBS 271.37 TaxID=1442368 RepID=A0A0D2GUK8_9EURO|nr:uncharacterized protein Z517_05327 [Fonsecaea pedrosoi CBS 271.37]KIW82300.1 hypothetical protein Z517_05327 [Fonsecaea pedrosoi CBS 271.37]